MIEAAVPVVAQGLPLLFTLNAFSFLFLHTQCVTFKLPEKIDIARPPGRPTGGKMHIVNGDLVPDSVLTLKKKLC